MDDAAAGAGAEGAPLMRDVPMERTAGVVIGALLAIAVVVELRGILRTAPGDTFSEFAWPFMLRWPGLLVCALCAWLLWHFPFGRGRGLSWPDALAAAVGVAVWLIARNNQP